MTNLAVAEELAAPPGTGDLHPAGVTKVFASGGYEVRAVDGVDCGSSPMSSSRSARPDAGRRRRCG